MLDSLSPLFLRSTAQIHRKTAVTRSFSWRSASASFPPSPILHSSESGEEAEVLDSICSHLLSLFFSLLKPSVADRSLNCEAATATATFCASLFRDLKSDGFSPPAFQDGRREHGNVGGAIQHHQTGTIRAQLKVLPVRVNGGLLHSALPIAAADDLLVEQIATAGAAHLLQHEMTIGEWLWNKFCQGMLNMLCSWETIYARLIREETQKYL